jgi:type II secretory pathway pseudopilin PulG
MQPYQPPPAGPRPGRMPLWACFVVGCGCLGMFGVVLLPALLFPVFSQAREKARQRSCQSNIRQINLAISMYTQDYDEHYPKADRWVDLCEDYLKMGSMFQCPSRGRNPSGYGYAFNSDLSEKTVKSISDLVSTPTVFDSTSMGRNATDAGTSLPNPPRHLSGNNVGYADGAARWIKGTGLHGVDISGH